MGIFSRKADGDIRHRAVDGAENENNTIRISWLFLRKSWLCYRGILVIAQILVILPRNLGYCFAGTIRFSIPVYRPDQAALLVTSRRPLSVIFPSLLYTLPVSII